jgi:hypothetical protein
VLRLSSRHQNPRSRWTPHILSIDCWPFFSATTRQQGAYPVWHGKVQAFTGTGVHGVRLSCWSGKPVGTTSASVQNFAVKKLKWFLASPRQICSRPLFLAFVRDPSDAVQ